MDEPGRVPDARPRHGVKGAAASQRSNLEAKTEKTLTTQQLPARHEILEFRAKKSRPTDRQRAVRIRVPTAGSGASPTLTGRQKSLPWRPVLDVSPRFRICPEQRAHTRSSAVRAVTLQ
jgi:hypothetical protein